MLNTCRGCGAEHVRTLSRYDEHMAFISEVCTSCHREMFEEFHDPSDNKILPSHIAFPERFKVHGDGQMYMKDEPLEDLRRAWATGPSQRMEDAKRARRRTTPMTEEEIRQANQWAESSGLVDSVKKQKQAALGITCLN